MSKKGAYDRGRLAIALAIWIAGLAGVAGAGSEPLFVQIIAERDLVAVADRGGSIQLLSFPGLEPMRQLRPAQAGPLDGVAVSGNGNWLAASTVDGGFWVWNLGLRSEPLDLSLPGSGEGVSYLFHPLDDRLFLFREGRLAIWNLASGQQVGQVRAVRDVEAMSLSPDGRFLAVGGSCVTGCGRFRLCVYSVVDDLLLAADRLQESASTPDLEIRDVVYLARGRVVLTSRLPGDEGLLRTAFAPATLRQLSITWFGDLDGLRAAPRQQLTHVSRDGGWKVAFSQGGDRLLVMRQASGRPQGEFELEKMVRIP